MARIEKALVDRARSVDLVDLVQQHGVKLRKSGAEWKGLCPFHVETGPSFSVNPEKGVYHCFGCGESGDSIEFMIKSAGLNFGEAVNELLSNATNKKTALFDTHGRGALSANTPSEADWQLVTPVPQNVLPAPAARSVKGEDGVWTEIVDTRRWPYHDATGALIGFVCRFDLEGEKKEFRPLNLWRNAKTGLVQWRWKGLPKPRPLYGLDLLAMHPEAQVLVVEGEKTADAARSRFEAISFSAGKLVIVTWSGGVDGVGHADWGPLRGRRIVLWPDAGDPGMRAMATLRGILQADVQEIKLVLPPEGVPNGWDLADDLPDGFDLGKHAKSAATLTVEVAPALPEPVAEAACSPQVAAPATLPVTAQVVDDVFDEGLREEVGILLLGRQSGSYAFWRLDVKSIEILKAQELCSHHGLQRLAPKTRWEIWAEGDFKPNNASDTLINISAQLGDVNLARVPSNVADPQVVRLAYARAKVRQAGPNVPPPVIAELMDLCPDWKGIVYFDELSGRPGCGAPPPCGGRAGFWEGAQDAQLGAWLHSRFGLDVSVKGAYEAVNLLAMQNRRHPVREYLEPLVWDGEHRLDTWLVRHGGAEDNQFVRAVSAKTLVAAVARAFEPGVKADNALVLEGKQGLRKSSLVRALVPNVSWFAEDLGGAIGGKDALVGLMGKWLVELAEIAAVRSSSVENVKSFLTRRVDSYRSPYGLRSEDHPRQCIFFGTVNPGADGRWLHDATGGRRFWPVAIQRCNVEGLEQERDQLWAEALRRWREGGIHWLTDQEEALAEAEQAERLEENPWAQAVNEYLQKSLYTTVTVDEIFRSAQARLPTVRDSGDRRRIAEVLRGRGWTKKLAGVDRLSTWFPPKDEPPM